MHEWRDRFQETDFFLYLISIKFFIVPLFLKATIYNLSSTTIICLFVILLTQIFATNYDCSLHTQRDFTQDWLNHYLLSALSCLFTDLHNSLTNVLKVAYSCSRFRKNSIATSLLFLYCVHIVYCCIRLLVAFTFCLTLLLMVFL